jgi:hypothetical protein
MNLSKAILISTLSVASVFLVVHCSRKQSEPTTGIISVLVVDNDPEGTPIPDVEITVLPGNLTGMTDADGKASFEVEAGEYFVDAEVCCVGPGNIHFHESVKVIAEQSVEVKLTGCLRCL